MNKNTKIIGGVILALLLIGGILFFNAGKGSQKQKTESVLENEPTIPPVDSSVKVDLKSVKSGKEVTLSVNGIPSGTESIEYELSYNTEAQGQQGALGTAEVKGQKSIEKTITLGTCSSGTCVYHNVEGPIKVSLVFGGSYGQKIFEKDYSL